MKLGSFWGRWDSQLSGMSLETDRVSRSRDAHIARNVVHDIRFQRHLHVNRPDNVAQFPFIDFQHPFDKRWVACPHCVSAHDRDDWGRGEQACDVFPPGFSSRLHERPQQLEPHIVDVGILMLVRFLRIIDLVRWNPLLQFHHVGGGSFVCRVYAVIGSLRRKTRKMYAYTCLSTMVTESNQDA